MVATRAQRAAVAAARPGARLDRLPVDLIAHIALYAGYRDDEEGVNNTSDTLGDLLALRCTCRACESAVRRAATDHAGVKYWYFRCRDLDQDQRDVKFFGQGFGSGCRKLDVSTAGDESPEVLEAFRGFVSHTQGRLLELDVSGESYGTGRAFVLELCGTCPQLKELNASWLNVGGATSASVSGFCEALGRACPLLERVDLYNKKRHGPLLGISPAESYQIHFSATKTLDFNVVSEEGYEPTRYDRIEATLEACVKVDAVNLRLHRAAGLGGCAAADAAEESSEDLRFRLCHNRVVRDVLRCAADFEALCDLRLPERWSGDPEFYRSRRSAPTITALNLGFAATRMARVCE